MDVNGLAVFVALNSLCGFAGDDAADGGGGDGAVADGYGGAEAETSDFVGLRNGGDEEDYGGDGGGGGECCCHVN